MRHSRRISKPRKPARALTTGITTKEGCKSLQGPAALQCKLVVKNGGEYFPN